MSDGFLCPGDRRSLKQAFSVALKKAGGQSAAAEHTRVDQTTLSRAASFTNPDCAECFPAADTVVEVDLLAGEPVMLRALARLLGQALVPLPVIDAAAPGGAEAARVVTELGQVLTALGQALSDDGRVGSVAEIDAILPELDDGGDAIARLKHVLVHRRAALLASEGRTS